MIKCPNCNAELSSDSKFCTECGKQIVENIKTEDIKKTKTNIMGFASAFPTMLLMIIVLIYVIVSCISMAYSPQTDGSVSGWYIILVLPIGLVMTGIPVIITSSICLLNGVKSNFLITLLACGVGYVSILLLKLYQNEFVPKYEHNNLIYTISLICIISSCALSLISNIVSLFRKKTS